MDALEQKRRNEVALDTLKNSAIFDAVFRERKEKRKALRLALIREIEEIKKTFPPQGLAFAERATVLAEALRKAEKEFHEISAAYGTATLQARAYADKFEGEIESRRRKLAKLSDDRIKQMVIWLETLDGLAVRQLQFWTEMGRDRLARTVRIEKSSFREVEEARAQLKALHKAALEMLYMDYGDDPLPELLKMKAAGEKILKVLNVNPIPELKFDELSWYEPDEKAVA